MERFYLEIVRKGVVPKPPSDDEGSERPRKMPKKSDEDEGPFDPRRPLMVWKSVRYGVSKGLDTAYFLRVGTTLDIFQNIILLYFNYDVLVFTGYGVLNLFPLWSLVSAGTDTSYFP
nr:hypothetical protein [Tanacetum cinerariifolium]